MNLETLKKANDLQRKINTINEVIDDISREGVCLSYSIGLPHEDYPVYDTQVERYIETDVIEKLCKNMIEEIKRHVIAERDSMLKEFEQL